MPYFMVRIRIPNGLLLSHQVRTIANVATRYARGLIDVTVRQNIQLHWVRIEDIPDLLEQLWRAGLTTMGSCVPMRDGNSRRLMVSHRGRSRARSSEQWR